jgi:hypothetical protein
MRGGSFPSAQMTLDLCLRFLLESNFALDQGIRGKLKVIIGQILSRSFESAWRAHLHFRPVTSNPLFCPVMG